jgi:hypothetical protein
MNTLLTIVVPLLVTAAIAAVVLRPARSDQARRLLRGCGIDDPAPDQVEAAGRYLRHWSTAFAPLAVVCVVLQVVAGPGDLGLALLLQPVLAAALLAEVVAQRRPAGLPRVASLAPRGPRELAPAGPVIACGVLVAVVLAVVVMALTGDPVARGFVPAPGAALLYAAVYLLVGAALVALAVRRPPLAADPVDRVLREVSVRRGVTLATAFVAGLPAAPGGEHPVVGWVPFAAALALSVWYGRVARGRVAATAS